MKKLTHFQRDQSFSEDYTTVWEPKQRESELGKVFSNLIYFYRECVISETKQSCFCLILVKTLS
jgi:hypothetical protein